MNTLKKKKSYSCALKQGFYLSRAHLLISIKVFIGKACQWKLRIAVSGEFPTTSKYFPQQIETRI